MKGTLYKYILVITCVQFEAKGIIVLGFSQFWKGNLGSVGSF